MSSWLGARASGALLGSEIVAVGSILWTWSFPDELTGSLSSVFALGDLGDGDSKATSSPEMLIWRVRGELSGDCGDAVSG